MKFMYRLYQIGCRIKRETEMDIIDWICSEMRKEQI